MAYQNIIWVVVNAEDTQGQANVINARGCKALCDARIEAGADMLYAELCRQAKLLNRCDRIVMHQGGARNLGGQLLRAAGYVKDPVRLLMSSDASSFSNLWEVTKRWYTRWPDMPNQLSGQQIIFYQLWQPASPQPSPALIRPRQGDKFIPLHANCQQHRVCAAYPTVDAWWRTVVHATVVHT